jgi:iron complex transport system substrate-binding protein
MRVFAYALAASLALVAASAEATPRRVASLNLCTDELLLMLAEPSQVASVTHLSHKPAETVLWRSARRYRLNDGSLLSVVSLRPDLLLTMGGGSGDKAGIARRLGLRIVDLPYPQSIADVERGISTVAAALGRPEAGRLLLGQIATLQRSKPRRQTDTVWLGGGGRSVGATGLAAQWMAMAGLRQRALPGDRIGLEELLTRPPRLLLRSDYRAGQYSAQQSWLRHRLVRGARARTLATDGRRWTCVGPSLIPEILRLRGAAA